VSDAARTTGGPAVQTRRGLWLSFIPPFGLEVAERAVSLDWIGVDLQHGDLGIADLAPLARTSRLPVYARAASHQPAELGRIIDCGVSGIVVPGVESADEARSLVEAVRMPPRGQRSTGLCRAAVVGTEPPALLAMIETAPGLAAVAEIGAVDGIDGLFIGPYDLSLSLGEESVTSPAMLVAIETVIAVARDHGKLAAVFAGNAALAAQLPPVDLLGVTTDAAALQLGLEQLFGVEASP
jgi:4-hydroxy-2-oxoheptanedioate aldolase